MFLSCQLIAFHYPATSVYTRSAFCFLEKCSPAILLASRLASERAEITRCQGFCAVATKTKVYLRHSFVVDQQKSTLVSKDIEIEGKGFDQ